MAKGKKKKVARTRTFTLDDDDYLKLSRIGYGNATRGLRKLLNNYQGVVPPEVKD